MRLEKYISQLLYRYPCVIVPGFGAFLTEIKSARLVSDTHTFHPPYKTVSFNSHVINNDGLLANAISIIEKISFDDAAKIIENAVINWYKELQSFDKFTLDEVGSFSKNSEGSLVFEPYLFANYYSGAFGLSPFVSPKVKRERFQKPERIVVNEPLVVKNEPLLLVPEEKILTHTTEELLEASTKKPQFVIVNETLKVIAKNNHPKPLQEPKIVVLKKPRVASLVKYAAAIFIGATLAGAGIKLHNDNVVLETSLMAKAIHNKVDNTIQQATFTINVTPPALPLPIKIEKAPFHVVASAYQDVNNAKYELEILQLAGFDSKILPKNEKGLHTVIYASFSSKDEANEFLKRIQKYYNPDAWLLVKNL